jgi:hypothetical protein
MLFVNYREQTSYEPRDLVELQHACNLIAAGILRLNLQTAIQKAFEQRNQILRAVVDIFRNFGRESEGLNLDLVATRAADALNIDACTLLEYVSARGRFSRRGIAGLRFPNTHYSLTHKFTSSLMEEPEPIVITDVESDELMKDSEYVSREGIKSAIIYPLRVEGEPLGLFFASYRELKEFSPEEIEAFGLFASLAAMMLHEEHLGDELNHTQQRLKRRLFLDWVSMIEATWRHSMVQKTSAIRNHATYLKKRLDQHDSLPEAMEGIPDIIGEIDRLAAEIADVPPRVPQSWEMERELLPLAALLEEVFERELKQSLIQARPPIDIRIDTKMLVGVQVMGFRRWLIYTLEALIQNARNAMPQGGIVDISGKCSGQWVEVRIRDSGGGVPDAIQNKIFKELIPKEQDMLGMGIGSLLAATILEDHDGDIMLEKPGPVDTTVLIRLPIAEENVV